MSITIVTGGSRSGKSLFAENKILKETEAPVYLATAKVLDDDFAIRVQRHQARRDERWRTVEEAINISQITIPEDSWILLDCVTLWITNIFFEHSENVDDSLEFVKLEWNRFVNKYKQVLVVTNEIGLGVVPENQMARKFIDLQGLVNQYIARYADSLYLMVSGIPMRIK